MSRERIRVAIHGGAGALPGHDYAQETRHMRQVVEDARNQLSLGAKAIDVVTAAVKELEASGLYIAGRGSSPNLAGQYELDACVMDGASARAGSIAALIGYQSPVGVARAVLEKTSHVMLAGEGAAMFAGTEGMPVVPDADGWFTRACSFEFNSSSPIAHGTVGCVALDQFGQLAAATSTGGVFEKRPGRVGDTPIVGAGTWADRHVAVSCTGQGEFFMRAAAGAQIAHRVRFGYQSLHEAVADTLSEIVALGGSGGVIAIDRLGNVCVRHASTGMKHAALLADGSIVSDVS